MRPSLSFHNGIGNRIPALISDLTLDAYRKGRERSQPLTVVSLLLQEHQTILLLDALKGYLTDLELIQ